MALHKKSIDYIKNVSLFFSEFASLVTLTESDAAECVKYLSEMCGFSSLRFPAIITEAGYCGCNFRELWCDAVNACGDTLFFNKEVKNLLLSFSEAFGKLGKSEFSEKCKQYSLRASEIYEKESRHREANSSVLSGLCVFCAAAIFIIFA